MESEKSMTEKCECPNCGHEFEVQDSLDKLLAEMNRDSDLDKLLADMQFDTEKLLSELSDSADNLLSY